MTTPAIVAAIDYIIDQIQADPSIDPDEAFDLVVQLQTIQAKAKVQVGLTMSALMDLKRAGVGIAPEVAEQFQLSEGDE